MQQGDAAREAEDLDLAACPPQGSLDQYAATLGGWFGVSDADLLSIFPNLPKFSPQKLGVV